MTRAQSICLVLAIAVGPVLSSCSVKTLPPAAPAIGTVELAKPKLTGTWNGSWTTGSYSGTFTMHITQKGKKFSGTVAITIQSVTTKGTIKGTIHKKKLTLVVSAKGLGTGSGTAQVNKTRTTMKGSVSIDGTKSTFSGSKM
ncbi:MAG TPA: hypothetical protein VKR56_01565 [Candidatus Cybelea sp.]|nr:hypothetical protein [Candidatus Cybelea sp.]